MKEDLNSLNQFLKYSDEEASNIFKIIKKAYKSDYFYNNLFNLISQNKKASKGIFSDLSLLDSNTTKLKTHKKANSLFDKQYNPANKRRTLNIKDISSNIFEDSNEKEEFTIIDKIIENHKLKYSILLEDSTKLLV